MITTVAYYNYNLHQLFQKGPVNCSWTITHCHPLDFRSLLWSTVAMTTQHIAALRAPADVDAFVSRLRELLDPPLVCSKSDNEHLLPSNLVTEEKPYDTKDEVDEVFVAGEAILMCSPDIDRRQSDRRDSGISVSSRLDSSPPSPYDNVGSAAMRVRSKRESLPRLVLASVPEDGSDVAAIKRSAPVREVTRPGTPTVESSPLKPSFHPMAAVRPTSLPLLVEDADQMEEQEEEEAVNTKCIKWIKLPEKVAKCKLIHFYIFSYSSLNV